MQLSNRIEEESRNIEVAEPLNYHSVEEESDGEMDTSIWVHQNIIKMSKEFGVVFEGCRKEALELFKKIDSNKHPITKEKERKWGKT